MTTSETTTEFGVQYPDGTFDWTTSRSFGSLDTPQLRRDFTKQYEARIRKMGIEPSPLQFFTRECTKTYTDPTVLED